MKHHDHLYIKMESIVSLVEDVAFVVVVVVCVVVCFICIVDIVIGVVGIVVDGGCFSSVTSAEVVLGPLLRYDCWC